MGSIGIRRRGQPHRDPDPGSRRQPRPPPGPGLRSARQRDSDLPAHRSPGHPAAGDRSGRHPGLALGEPGVRRDSAQPKPAHRQPALPGDVPPDDSQRASTEAQALEILVSGEQFVLHASCFHPPWGLLSSTSRCAGQFVLRPGAFNPPSPALKSCPGGRGAPDPCAILAP